MQVVADVALAERGAFRQGEGAHPVGDGAGGVEGQPNHAHLRAVAVGYHNLVALLDEIHQRRGGVCHPLALLRRGAAQSVAPKGNYNACHSISPISNFSCYYLCHSGSLCSCKEKWGDLW